MAFVTGSASSASDLLAAIQNACTANGWTKSASGAVLYKGTCYAELKVSATAVSVRGCRGVDGSGNATGLTDRGTAYVGLSFGAPDPFVWPCTYFIHILADPDEVYVVVNYATNTYQNLGFGQSAMPGLVGTGNWYCGSTGSQEYGGVNANGEYSYSSYGATSFFMRNYDSAAAHGVDHQLDSNTWSNSDGWSDVWQFFGRQPNQWSQESILIPLRAFASRPSGFISPVLELAHCRAVSIANLADQQVITLGSDQWRIYPIFKRGTDAYQSTYSPTGSWYLGHAIRYDGP
jgi:hypothetical protein